MRQGRFTEDQIIGALREYAVGVKAGSTSSTKLPRQQPPTNVRSPQITAPKPLFRFPPKPAIHHLPDVIRYGDREALLNQPGRSTLTGQWSERCV